MKALLLSMALVAGVGMAQSAAAMPVQGIPAHPGGPQGMPVHPYHGIHGIIYHPHPHPIYGHRVWRHPYHPYPGIHGIIIGHPGVGVHHPIGVVVAPNHGGFTQGVPVDPGLQHNQAAH